MTAQANPSPTDGDDAIGLSRNGRLGALAAYLATWCATCADYYEAAAGAGCAVRRRTAAARSVACNTRAKCLYGLRRTVTQSSAGKD
jgi:hypothetical protein